MGMALPWTPVGVTAQMDGTRMSERPLPSPRAPGAGPPRLLYPIPLGILQLLHKAPQGVPHGGHVHVSATLSWRW